MVQWHEATIALHDSCACLGTCGGYWVDESEAECQEFTTRPCVGLSKPVHVAITSNRVNNTRIVMYSVYRKKIKPLSLLVNSIILHQLKTHLSTYPVTSFRPKSKHDSTVLIAPSSRKSERLFQSSLQTCGPHCTNHLGSCGPCSLCRSTLYLAERRP